MSAIAALKERRGCRADKQEGGAGSGKIVLVGSPNVGKSVIFGRLTGRYVTVPNYPGTTGDPAKAYGHGRAPRGADRGDADLSRLCPGGRRYPGGHRQGDGGNYIHKNGKVIS